MQEAQEVNNESFRTQCQPFVTRTAGVSYVLGKNKVLIGKLIPKNFF